MPRKPDGNRPLTVAERSARKRQRRAEREAELLASMRRIRDEAATIREARQIATEALASKELP